MKHALAAKRSLDEIERVCNQARKDIELAAIAVAELRVDLDAAITERDEARARLEADQIATRVGRAVLAQPFTAPGACEEMARYFGEDHEDAARDLYLAIRKAQT